MKPVEDYLRNADECRKLSEKAGTPEQRRIIETIMETWEKLAEQRRRLLERK